MLNFFAGKRGFDISNGSLGVTFAANLCQYAASAIRFPIFGEPARAFGYEQHSEEKQQRRRCGETKHPAPALLSKPGRTDEFIGCPCRQVADEKPIDVLSKQNTNDDGKLIDRDQLAANLCRSNLRNVHRRKIRGQTNPNTAEDAPGDKNGEVV